MKKIALLLLPIIFIMASSLVSCKGNKDKQEQKKISAQEVEAMTKEIEETVYPLPTSADVIKMLTELEVGYIIGISNPTENVSNYLTSSARAINLGVYGADLSYATLYNMNQDVVNYLTAIRSLANDLNMGRIYSEKLYEEIKDSFDNRDKLVEILTNAFNGTYSYLSENDQQSLALMVVAGAWVEGMYITTHISESVYHVEGMARVILEQKKSFELFLEIAKPHADDPNVKKVLEDLDPMRVIYEGIDNSLTVKNVEDITSTIELIRDKMVS
jgi:hypothetical protein